ncbi:hypothetical protein Glove_349g125 [Diversispora epigaea]|uniref:Uncharacterized protein n=1 Tax=Diversispora epigaea TaxID=1348612 RepID=A0A397HEG1_9GLOM|nr:hypothetical protein Glove_349g125 [Diversispora epigaea]
MDSIFHHPPPSEDYVSYSLYFPPPSPPPPDTNNADTNNNANTNNSDTKNDSINDYIKFLQENIVLILSELNQFLDGYIWQKELFKLRIVKNETEYCWQVIELKNLPILTNWVKVFCAVTSPKKE